jgi:fibronectin-binding autotransporter adhesin
MRIRHVLILLFLLCGFQTGRTYGQVVATWTDSSGNWSNGANWSTLSAPTNGGGTFYNAVINGTGADTVTFDASGTRINSLSLGAGETFRDNGLVPTLTIGDPAFPAAGSLTNNGTINWGNGANLVLDISAGNGTITNNPSASINLTNSTLTLSDSGNGNAAALSGGGTINLNGGTITGSSGVENLTNNDNTIQGAGAIRNLTLVNNGTINANGAAPLSITSSSGGFTNNGTVNATGLGGLAIDATVGPLTNNGTMTVNGSSLKVSGNFSQNNAGSLTLQNGSSGLISGSLNNNWGSPSNPTVTVDNSNLTLKGDFNGGNGNTLTVKNGGILNIGGSYNSGFNEGSVSVSGGSVVTISGSFSNVFGFLATVDNSTLIVKSGFGTAGLFTQTSINNSVLLVDGGAGVANGAVLSIGGSSAVFNGDFSNSQGTLSVGYSAMSVNGNIDIQNDGWTYVGNSSLSSSGTLTIDQQGGGGSNLILLGSGSNANLNAVQNSGLVQVDAGSNLTVGSGGFTNNCITGLGTVNLGGTMTVNGGFTNNGGSVLLAPTANLKADTYAQSGGLTDISGTLIANSYTQSNGATTIESGGLVKATTFQATGGTVTVNGTLDPTAVEFASGATLQGTGTIVGNVAMGGTIMPGGPGTPGTLTIFGNYEQIGSGTLDELMSPVSRALLHVSGDVALDSGSMLQITLLNGFNPLGQTFSIMDYNSLVGEFSNGSSFWDDGYLWNATYGQHEIDVTAVKTPEPSSLLLLGLGSMLLGGLARRKIKAA